MKVSKLLRIWPGLLLIAGLATVGCGSRETPGASAGDPERPRIPFEELAARSAAEVMERAAAAEAEANEAAELERAEAIARRAAELERAEAEVAKRTRELDRKMFELEEREFATRRDETEPDVVDNRRLPARESIPARMHLPQGYSLEIEFLDALSSELSEIGNTVRARVVGDAAPAGATLWGRVSDVRSERKIGSSARLGIAFDEMELPSGQLVPIQAELAIEGMSQKKKDTAAIGGGAAGGAILGRVLSKNRKKGKGTAVGAILGAAVGAAIASENRGDPVVIEPGRVARLELDAPVEWSALGTPAALVAGEY